MLVQGQVCIDPSNPSKKLTHPATIYPMRDCGDNALLDIAFQVGQHSVSNLQGTCSVSMGLNRDLEAWRFWRAL